jgi:Zn-dependent protease
MAATLGNGTDKPADERDRQAAASRRAGTTYDRAMADTQERSGIRLGSVVGVPVILQRSWFVVAGVLMLLVGPQVTSFVPSVQGAAAYAVALAFAGLLLASVFLHELAHALVARAVGTPPTDIVLDLWGGHTAFAREVPTAGRSILVAAVGPLTNGLIAALAFLALGSVRPGGVAEVLALLLAWSNGFVAVLNALPGLPLDGGRVLEGVVWAATGARTTGTSVAGWCGRIVAVGVVGWLVGLPLVRGQRPGVVTVVWVLAVAWMLWQGASQAIRYAGWLRIAASVNAGRLMTPAVTVPSTATVADARAASHTQPADRPVPCVVVLDIYGRPAGVLDDAAFGSVPPQRADLVGVGAVARTLPQVQLRPDLSGEELVARLRADPSGEYVVVDGGRVVGVLSWSAVAAAVAAR